MSRYVLLTSMVIKYICTKAPKSWDVFLLSSQAGPTPVPFQPNPFSYSWSLCTLLPLQIFPGLRVQGTANRSAPPLIMSPLLKIRWEMVDPNPYFAAYHSEMWISTAYTPHPLQTLSDFSPHISLAASWFCALSKYYIFGLLGLLVNKWKLKVYCT